MDAEEFTELLYQELKSAPQPCLVPFLKVQIHMIVTYSGVCKDFIHALDLGC